jgi:colanic acid/amylovoran biosynthesis glycosyltransferase
MISRTLITTPVTTALPRKPLLVILPSLKVVTQVNGQKTLTKKFIDGIELYREFWPGDIKILIEETTTPDSNLDHVNINQINKVQLEIADYTNIGPIIAKLEKNSIVLASIHYRQNLVAKICKAYKIPCVQASEYTLKTRLKIAKLDKKNPLKRWRSYIWEYLQEKKNISSIEDATGLQCNGLPTYFTYREINPNSILYFDSRSKTKDIISPEDLQKKANYSYTKKPLRLFFSGRLNKLKGADHLILFAKALNDLGVDFSLTICGDGELKETMLQSIKTFNLSKKIVMAGVLDFTTELLPLIKEHIDLFVCCHRQGDPSCTYIETMSCGVPIISYNNEAFDGLNNTTQCGWKIPMDHYDLMAEKVRQLDNNRDELIIHSKRSMEFCLDHSFEMTFEKRINHLSNLLEQNTSQHTG